MSLDIYLTDVKKIMDTGLGIRNGDRELTIGDVVSAYPDVDMEILKSGHRGNAWSRNITHNLNEMAKEAGLYGLVWEPEENGVKRAGDLISPLTWGLQRLIDSPEKFKQFNPRNGWGTYEGLVRFVEAYLDACCEFPDAEVYADR